MSIWVQEERFLLKRSYMWINTNEPGLLAPELEGKNKTVTSYTVHPMKFKSYFFFILKNKHPKKFICFFLILKLS